MLSSWRFSISDWMLPSEASARRDCAAWVTAPDGIDNGSPLPRGPIASAFTSSTHIGRTVRRGSEEEKMKALVQEGSGSADVLHLREIDKPIVPAGHVLVRGRAASVHPPD